MDRSGFQLIVSGTAKPAQAQQQGFGAPAPKSRPFPKALPALKPVTGEERSNSSRSQHFQQCLQEANEKAAITALEPLWQGRIALLGLFTLAVIRVIAWSQGNIPGYSVFGMHFLTSTADATCLLSTMPLFLSGTRGRCVQVGCVGPMLTLVFAMSIVDMGALCAYMVVATPRPLSPGSSRSFMDVLEATLGVWEFALVASVCFQLSLCASAWRVYRELRVFGLYPPGSAPLGAGHIEEVSFLELVCEVEDAKLVNECDCMGDSRTKGSEASPSPSGDES